MNSEEMKMLQTRRFPELIGILTRKLETKPTNLQAKMDLALVYSQSGEQHKAKQLYEEILAEDRDNVEALINVGIVYHWLGDDGRALETCRKAIRLDRERPAGPEFLSLAYSNLGVVFEALAQFERAVIAYKKALSIYPGNQLASKYIANLREAGDADHGILRARVLPNGKKIPDLWYYQDFDIDKIKNIDEILGI